MFATRRPWGPACLAAAGSILTLGLVGAGCQGSRRNPDPPPAPPATLATQPSLAPAALPAQTPRPSKTAVRPVPPRADAPGRARTAGYERYDEPKEALEFFAQKRAPVGQRAIP